VINNSATAGAGVVNLNTAGVTLTGSGTVKGQVIVVASNNSSAANNTHVDGITIQVLSGGTGLIVDGMPTVGTPATFVQIGVNTGVTINGGSSTSTGIVVQRGASARIFNSTITGQNVGVNVNGGTAALQSDHIDNDNVGSTPSGLLVQNSGIVDAGQLAGSATPLPGGPAGNVGYYGDITGLFSGTPLGSSAHSTGNNTFLGYTASTSASSPTVAQAVRDMNTGTSITVTAQPNGVEQSFNYSAAGALLGRMDVTAQNNTWGTTGGPVTTLSGIEQLVYHDLDSTGVGFVSYGTPTVVPPTIVSTVQYFAAYATSPTASNGFGTLASGANNLATGQQRSLITGITVTFSGYVFLDPNLQSPSSNRGLNLIECNGTTYNLGNVCNPISPTGRQIAAGLSASTSYNQSNGQYTVVWSFSGTGTQFGSLEDGNYNLQFIASAIQGGGPGGPALGSSGFVNPATYSAGFHRYFGDVNGDGLVDATTDYPAFNTAYRSVKGQAAYRAYFDLNSDGAIAAADYNYFMQHYKTRLNADGTVSTLP
jgi:X-X-X-Leu-X-X-Gly heptad repeat protein